MRRRKTNLREECVLGALLLLFIFGLYGYKLLKAAPNPAFLSTQNEEASSFAENAAGDGSVMPSEASAYSGGIPDVFGEAMPAASDIPSDLEIDTAEGRPEPEDPLQPEGQPSSGNQPSPIPVEDNPRWHDVTDIIGINDILYEPETDAASAQLSMDKDAVTFTDAAKLYDFEYMRTKFYIIDTTTGLLASDIDMDAFLQADLRIETEKSGPKMLIFHTHSNEMYVDSDPLDPMDGIMGIGRRLAEILQHDYGVETLHHTGRYDIVNGKSSIPGAYERMEPAIEQILRDNPSIQLVIDMHRDGLREGVPPMVTDINGQRTARIMFVNGLSRIKQNDVLTAVSGLANPYITDNLMFSFQLQLAANELYPNFTRKVYLKPYRYSLHMLPKSVLVEIGAQNNTKQEALNAMPPLAKALAQVVLP